MTKEEAIEAIKEAYGNSEYTDEIIKALMCTTWIPVSVSERPPEKDKEVLIYIDHSPYLATYEDGEWNTDNFTVDPENEPTTWWELPEPVEDE